jgi:NADPH-dependent glutamate synthase beta subunit-like oxidoreductase
MDERQDWERRQGKMAPPTFLERIKDDRVAIVGAGPAGLNTAYHLGRKGYPVTIFEALPVAGGMLAVGIPAFRLPREIIDYDIRFICQHNVDIRTEKALGKDFTIDDLFQQGYKVVLLALGAHGNTRLGISGEEAQGVLPGVDFLRRVNLGEDVEVGAKVAVIGGGDVAIDAARCALRLGADNVVVVYRRSPEEMPAHRSEIKAASEEGVEFLTLSVPVKILGHEQVERIPCIKMKLGPLDESGRRKPSPRPSPMSGLDCHHARYWSASSWVILPSSTRTRHPTSSSSISLAASATDISGLAATTFFHIMSCTVFIP